ncbi:MAG: hypothetical protein NUW24_06955 [Anaerolineae bacterium]|nr:hypothetical protein [Anaerolineae bacterium]MDH7472697.1 hypothetical protein [Anaerolineae bacterium]
MSDKSTILSGKLPLSEDSLQSGPINRTHGLPALLAISHALASAADPPSLYTTAIRILLAW